jgi:hypothetical protein
MHPGKRDGREQEWDSRWDRQEGATQEEQHARRIPRKRDSKLAGRQARGTAGLRKGGKQGLHARGKASKRDRRQEERQGTGMAGTRDSREHKRQAIYFRKQGTGTAGNWKDMQA